MTDLLSRANVNIAINTLLNDLQPNDAIQPSDHNGLLGSILDTLANGLSTTLRTGNTTGGFSIDVTDGDTIKYNKGGSFVGVLDSLTLTGSRSWDFPDNSGTIALLSDITGGDNIATANLTFTTNRNQDLAGFGLTFSDGQTTIIGAGTTDATNSLLVKSANIDVLKTLDNGDVHIGELLQGVGRQQKLAFQPLDNSNFLEAYSANSTNAGAPRFSMGLTSNVPFLKGKDNLDLSSGLLKIRLQDSARRILLQYDGLTFARFDQNGVGSFDGVYGFGFGTASPNSSAKVEIKSTTGGLLIPRMSGVQATAITGVNGLSLYVTSTNGVFTSNGFWDYEEGAWVKR